MADYKPLGQKLSYSDFLKGMQANSQNQQQQQQQQMLQFNQVSNPMATPNMQGTAGLQGEQMYGNLLKFGNSEAEAGKVNMSGFQTPDAATLTEPQSAGMFDNVGGMDMLNFGMGAAQLGMGAYYQNKGLGIKEDTLALAQNKFKEYTDQAETRKSNILKNQQAGRKTTTV